MSAPLEKRRELARKKHTQMSQRERCGALCVHRSGLHYSPRPESPLNLELMRLMDEKYLHTPFYGVPKMWDYLRKKRQ